MISARITTPDLPTPALQWTSTGVVAPSFSFFSMIKCRLTESISSKYALKEQRKLNIYVVQYICRQRRFERQISFLFSEDLKLEKENI